MARTSVEIDAGRLDRVREILGTDTLREQQLTAAFCWAPTGDDLWERVDELQDALTGQGQQRSASLADLIVAVTAEAHGLTVLHYDNDFDTIAKLTDQPVRWAVPAGAI